jgi:MFS family permease
VLLVGGSVQPLIVGTWLPLAAMAALIAVSGASISVLFVIWDTTLAREIPPQALSRVSSFDFFGSVVGMPLGFAVIGPVSDWLGLTATMVIASSIGVAWALVTALLPSVRGLREDPTATTTRDGGPVPEYHALHPPTDPSPAPPSLA